MREFVLATRAIWANWNDGTPLQFAGDFYEHTLTSPMFTPTPNPYGPPPIYIAGVGERMTEVAGEVADGFLAHAFTTEKYLRKVTLPALKTGRAKVGLNMDGFAISATCFVIVADDANSLSQSVAKVKQQIAFYGSTPAYRPVLETHGWGELGDELHRLTLAKRWDALGDTIDDDVVTTFAIIGPAGSVADQIAARFDGLLTRVTLSLYGDLDPSQRGEIVSALRATSSRRKGF